MNLFISKCSSYRATLLMRLITRCDIIIVYLSIFDLRKRGSNWRVCAFTDRRVIKIKGKGGGIIFTYLQPCYAKEGNSLLGSIVY